MTGRRAPEAPATPAGRVTGLQLPIAPEPAALRRRLRAVAADRPARAAGLLVDAEGVADHLWRCWGEELERAGTDRAGLLDVVAGYRRELWHWLCGDRTWEQCAQGLAGRLARRAPLPACAEERR